ncbi:MAG: hypothetical protein SFV22_19245 [Saprospiraceae bacterium]|nr:hypothetical protein [Saprospiraceae bacterium]
MAKPADSLNGEPPVFVFYIWGKYYLYMLARHCLMPLQKLPYQSKKGYFFSLKASHRNKSNIVADESVDFAIEQFLREQGLPVFAIAEQSPSITDNEVLKRRWKCRQY